MIEREADNYILNKVFNGEAPAAAYLHKWDDTSVSDVTFLGYSAVGELTSSTEWWIKKIDESTKTISRAEGSWDDRLTLTYV